MLRPGMGRRSHLRLVSAPPRPATEAELDVIRNGPPAALRVSACAGAIEHLQAEWDQRKRPEDENWRLPEPEPENRLATRAAVRGALLWGIKQHRLMNHGTERPQPIDDWRRPMPPWERVNLYVLGATFWTESLDALVRGQADRATKGILIAVAAGTLSLNEALSQLRDVRGWLEKLGHLRALKGDHE